MNKEQIIATIIAGTFNNDELNDIIQAVTFARNRIAQKNTFTIRAGRKVKWHNSRTGNEMVGVVTKVNTKTIIVDTDRNGTWRVSANMLSLVD